MRKYEPVAPWTPRCRSSAGRAASGSPPAGYTGHGAVLCFFFTHFFALVLQRLPFVAVCFFWWRRRPPLRRRRARGPAVMQHTGEPVDGPLWMRLFHGDQVGVVRGL